MRSEHPNHLPKVRGELWECLDCGGWMSRLVLQGQHAIRVVKAKPVNCVGREVTREEQDHG